MNENKFVIGLIVVLAVGIFAVAALNMTQPTGAAVAAYEGNNNYMNGEHPLGFYFGKGITFTDDITCKEWNLCFAGFFDEFYYDGNGNGLEEGWHPIEVSTNGIVQDFGHPFAWGECVFGLWLFTMYGPEIFDNGIFDNGFDGFNGDLPELVPIPPECVEQKDPTITSIGEAGEMPLCEGRVALLNPGLTCAQASTDHSACNDEYYIDPVTGLPVLCTFIQGTCQDFRDFFTDEPLPCDWCMGESKETVFRCSGVGNEIDCNNAKDTDQHECWWDVSVCTRGIHCLTLP